MTRDFSWAAAAFLLFLFVHWGLTRAYGGDRFMRRNIALFLISSFVGLSVYSFVLTTSGFNFLSALTWFCVFSSFWVAYTQVLVNAQNSISLRVLMEVSKAAEGSLALEEMEKTFPDRKVFLNRLAALETNGLLIFQIEKNDVQLTKKGAGIARSMITLKNLLRIRDSG